MNNQLYAFVAHKFKEWLVREMECTAIPLYDVNCSSLEIRPCDVLLVKGRSRVSKAIRFITQSPWTHCALYIGRLDDTRDPDIRARIQQRCDPEQNEQLLAEALPGRGIIINPLAKYRTHRLRICRPKRLSPDDAQRVIAHVIGRLGSGYDVRQLLDLARFLSPYHIAPRRWRSSLFGSQPNGLYRTICSSLLAEAFMSVDFPVLSGMRLDVHGRIRAQQRNTRLFTPRHFDDSPYFQSVNVPLIGKQDTQVPSLVPQYSNESTSVINTSCLLG